MRSCPPSLVPNARDPHYKMAAHQKGTQVVALLNLVVIGGIVLTVIYIALSIWSRRTRRSKLEAEWLVAGRPGVEEEFVDAGLREYDGSVRRKLILGVYVVPVAAVALIVYWTNFK